MNKHLFEYKHITFNFEYGNGITYVGKFVHPTRVTTCIMVCDGVESRVTVSCNYKDRYSKQAGRKAALTKTIRSADKATRKAIWELYFEKVKK